MRILIAGDLSLQDRANQVWKAEALQNAFSAVKAISKKCDHSIVNLESPVTGSNKPIIKDGPSLKNTAAVFDVIKYCGFDIATLANNHLKDYGSQGVTDTIEKCKENGLLVVGAGPNLAEARKALVLTDSVDGIKIGVINICEHESSIALRTIAGANPLDFPYLYEDICKLKEQTDKIIVIIHGGREHYQLPTPRMKREYRMVVDMGADVVINHHQHCYSGYEIYNGSPIFYGLGNFFFDNPRKRDDKWNYGLMLELDINKDYTDFQLLPYEQCNNKTEIKVMPYEAVKEKVDELNSIIADDIKLETSFDKLVMSEKLLYPFLPFSNRYYRFLYFKGLLPAFISKKNKALIENAESCETHREVLMSYFRIILNHE